MRKMVPLIIIRCHLSKFFQKVLYFHIDSYK